MWIDNKGTLRKFGQEKGYVGHAGGYTTDGALREVEIHLDLTKLGDETFATTNSNAVANGIIDLHTLIPAGAQIEAIDLVVASTVSSANSSALLNVGVVDQDFVSNDDVDALIDDYALVTAAAAIGTRVQFAQGTTGHGVLVGEILTKPLYLTACYAGQAFTAGSVDVRIKYNMNHQAPNNGPGSHS